MDLNAQPINSTDGHSDSEPLYCVARKMGSASQFAERRNRSHLFSQAAKAFLLDLPGVIPTVALLLDADNVVLDYLVQHGDDRPIPVHQMELFESGSPFTPANRLGQIPDYYTSATTTLPTTRSADGTRWYGLITSIRSAIDSDTNRIAFLTDNHDLLGALATSLTICAHAIYHNWMAMEDEETARVNRVEAISLLTPQEGKLLDYEKNSSLAALCAGIAHEIRNPLTAARGFLQLFARNCREDDLQFLQLTIHELDRVGQLVQDFMQVARPTDEVAKETDLCQLTYSVFQFLLPEANLYDVELTCELPTAPVQLKVQAGRIKQVFINLLQNALHACDRQGSVNIHIEDIDHSVFITIIDNGCGISDLDQLFRPFHTTKENGTGLGMFVSKHIIEQHRGHIHVQSAAGQGTKLVIRLPRLS